MNRLYKLLLILFIPLLIGAIGYGAGGASPNKSLIAEWTSATGSPFTFNVPSDLRGDVVLVDATAAGGKGGKGLANGGGGGGGAAGIHTRGYPLYIPAGCNIITITVGAGSTTYDGSNNGVGGGSTQIDCGATRLLFLIGGGGGLVGTGTLGGNGASCGQPLNTAGGTGTGSASSSNGAQVNGNDPHILPCTPGTGGVFATTGTFKPGNAYYTGVVSQAQPGTQTFSATNTGYGGCPGIGYPWSVHNTPVLCGGAFVAASNQVFSGWGGGGGGATNATGFDSGNTVDGFVRFRRAH